MKMSFKLVLLLLLTLPAVIQAQWIYAISNGTITITGYSGPGGAVTIPSTIKVGGVYVPVASIGNGALKNKSLLTSVSIPNTVTNVGAASFAGCSSLASVTIGTNVITIGDGAFQNCTLLTSVAIPEYVTSVGNGTFVGCTSLTAITVDALNLAYSGMDGVLFDKSQTMLIVYPEGKAGNYIVPNIVTGIGSQAFESCTSLTNATLGNSVTSIGDSAFSNCTSLASVTIGSSVTSIGGAAFQNCTSLTSVMIPNSVNSIGTSAFYWCPSLTNVTIGNGITSIGAFVFCDCGSLASVTIPNSVTNIGAWAFCACALPRVTIPNSVTSIGEYAFEGCGLNSVTIPTSVTDLGPSAFATCIYMTTLTIPSSITNIADSTFYDCWRLTRVYFQGNAPSFGSNVFEYDDKATVYYLPGTTGWGTTFAGLPTALWLLPNPLILSGPSFGVQTNQFGFIISWATNRSVVVEAATNLANLVWSPVSTNTLTSGSSYFSDPQWTNYPERFYRLRSP
jgi:BspA type Leucine rich repeat region (6 copies)